MLTRTPKHKSQRFPNVDLDVGSGRKMQNPPSVAGAGKPTHKKHRFGETDDVGAGAKRYNPKGI